MDRQLIPYIKLFHITSYKYLLQSLMNKKIDDVYELSVVFLLLLNRYVDFLSTLFNNIVYRMFILCNNKIDVNEIHI